MTTRPTKRAMAAGAFALLITTGMLTAPTAAHAAEGVLLSKGHVDAMDVHWADGRLSLKVHDDTTSPSVLRDPADVTFQVLPQAKTTVPDLPSYSFLGVPGTEIWILPQVQDQNLLWPGWNTTTLGDGVFADNRVKLSLVGVDGPGDVSLFGSTAFGDAIVYFRSNDGLPDALNVPTHTHAHASWAFSREGNYTLKWQADAVLRDGTAVSTGPVDYRFVVGEAQNPQPDDVTVAVDGLGDGVEYQPGDQVTLRAVQTPQTEHEHYHWFTRCAGAADWAIVPSEVGGTYTFTATRELNGCEYQVRLYDHDHAVLAASEPAALWVAFPSEEPAASQRITASIDADEGALIVSVDPDDRDVVLPAAELSGAGDRWESTGELRPVTVTDTRPGTPGWNVAGQIPAPFTSAEGTEFSSSFLGWTPQVVSQGNGQNAVAGPAVAPYVAGAEGTGLASSAQLATAAAGAGRGTARLSAGLRLSVPTETAAGRYTSTLTLTAI